MSDPRIDPTLDLPRDVATVAVIPEPEDGLLVAGRAEGRALRLTGVRCRVRADGLHGVLGVEADGRALCGAVRTGAPPGANQLATPRSLTIERIGAAGSVREAILVPERLPGVVVQWAGDTGEDGIALEVVLPTDAARVHRAGPRLRWARETDDGGGVLVLASAGDRPDWGLTLDEGDATAGAVRAVARIHPAPDAPVTLLAAAVDGNTRLPSLPALAAVAAHRRRDALEPHDAPGLKVSTGVADLDDGVAWARALLRGAPGAPEGDPSASATVLRGALAAAEMPVARAVLGALGDTPDDVEALALWVAWTAEGAPLLEARDRVEAALGAAVPSLRSRVADAAEAAGDERWAEALRAPQGPGGRGLPTVGGRSLPTVGTAGVGGSDDPGTGPLDAGAPSPWARVREELADLRRRGPSGDVVPAAETLDRLVRSALGLRPDAAYGRLTLRPAFPLHWNAFEASGIALGDARVGFSWERDGSLHRFRLRQTAGGAPITWILEPWLHGGSLAAARIDGEPADLDATRVGDGVRPRVQLPAERERVVEMEVTSP